MKDLTIILEDRPGTLADLCEVLGRVGINIEGLCGIPCEGKGIAHILVEDAAAARSTLEEAGIEVSAEREVLLLDIENKPGALGKVCRRLADGRINLNLGYIAGDNRVVLGVDDLAKARATL